MSEFHSDQGVPPPPTSTFRSAPLVPVALALTAGVLCTAWISLPASVVLGTALSLAVAAGALALVGYRVGPPVVSPRTLAHAAALSAVFLLGYGHARLGFEDFGPGTVTSRAGPVPVTTRLRGRVVDEPSFPPVGSIPTAYDFRAPREIHVEAPLEAEAVQVRGEWQPTRGRVRLIAFAPLPDIAYGQRLEIAGQLYTPSPPTNPGEFDFATYLRRQGMGAVLSVETPEHVTLQEQHTGTGAFAAIFRFKARLRADLTRYLSPGRAGTDPARVAPRLPLHTAEEGVAAALLLGDRDGLDPALEDAYQRSGTIHFMAISGLNIAMVGALIWGLLRLAGAGRRSAIAGVMAVSMGYAILTGASPSAMRAAIMIWIFLAAELLGRNQRPLNTLAAAAVLILVLDPADAFNRGFQLSFLAVAGIITFTPILEARFFPDARKQALSGPWPGRFKAWVLLSLALSVGAWTATAPLVALSFNYVTPGILLLNLPMVPLVWLAQAGGLLLLGLALVLPPAAAVVAAPLSMVLRAQNGLVRWAADLPGVSFYTATPPWWAVAAFYLFGVLLVRAWTRGDGSWKKPALAAALCANLAVFGPWLAARGRDGLDITVLDVGHGLSCHLALPGGGNLLYDCGSYADIDTGSRLVAPYLWDRGVLYLDAVVLSHSDFDHVSGLGGLLAKVRVGKLIVPVDFEKSASGPRALELARAHHVRVVRGHAGMRLAAASGVVVELVHPPDPKPAELNSNDACLVLSVRTPWGSCLLPGDIEEAGMEALPPLPPHEVLLLPHHGRWEDTFPALLDKVRPAYAIIPAPGSGPHDRERRECERRGIQVWIAGEKGAVTASFSEAGLKLGSYLESGTPAAR